MNYIEYSFQVNPKHPFTDILVAQLAEIGFESFCETDMGVQAYIQEEFHSAEILNQVEILTNPGESSISYKQNIIPQQNWNALWESNFDPVKVGMECMVRAPFHEKHAGFKFDIVIDPKMSFGTGHHDTTMLMIEEILKLNMPRKRVLDMGCGTAVLAILAAKMDAEKIVAIDNEEWAYKNAMENCATNNCQQILVIHGNASHIPNNSFDYIFANINKNVLLADMQTYFNHLSTDGRLFMSGFFTQDILQIKEHAESLGLRLLTQVERNTWAIVVFEKK
ncbi:MAG TPA: 50S ribosomal protein L11 methyltransferase [Bacteroidia bacterium]|nr:50S ribosomal protein L11 methyltransferase [Bacteroidia bacterium]